MSDKVFCKNCKNMSRALFDAPCNSPNNKCDTHYSAGSGRLKTPEEKNKNNDCLDYTPREYKEIGRGIFKTLIEIEDE